MLYLSVARGTFDRPGHQREDDLVRDEQIVPVSADAAGRGDAVGVVCG